MEHATHTLAIMASILDTAAEIVDRAHADGIDDIGDAHDVARSIAERITERATREARAVHSWFHADAPTGDEDPMPAAPDAFERVRAHRRTVRTNTGASVQMVTVHGRAFVQGDRTARPSRWSSMSAEHLTHAIATVPHAVGGLDSVSLARLTDVAFPDVPRLIGGDVLSFEEFGAWDETRARTPRRGMPTRYRLPRVVRRNGETGAAHELIAPTGDTDTVFIGHRRVMRSETVREQRAQRARRVNDSVTVNEHDDVAVRLARTVADVTAPYSVAWALIDDHGAPTGARGTVTVTGDRKRRYSATGLSRPVRGHRSPDALARAIAQAL